MTTNNDLLSSGEYLRKAKEAAKRLGANGRTVTIEQVRNEVGNPPSHVSPQLMGQVFRGKDWEKVGVANAERETANSRRISTFRLKFAA